MKMTMKLTASLFIVWSSIAWMQQPKGLEKHFQGFDGAFVIYDSAADSFTRFNPKRCATRFTPCSTFKIPNGLIALETGVAKDAHHFRKYDPQAHPRQDWMSDWLAKSWLKDHTLRSAIKNSVVWYFQEQAKEIGPSAMAEHLKRFNYGNQDISGGITQFWLSSSLTISPDEQVAFLRDFYDNRFQLSQKTHLLMKDMLVLKQTENYRISGKTGSDGKGLGWLVGYVETPQNTWFFAYNAQLPKDKRHIKYRRKLVEDLLQEMKII